MEKADFEYIINKYVKLIYYFASNRLNSKEDVEDIVQDTFLKAFENIDRFEYKNELALKSWLLTICKNLVINSFRKRKDAQLNEKILPEIETDESFIEEIEESEISEDQLVKLNRSIDSLNKLDKEILKLRTQEEMNFIEIGKLVGLKEDACKMRYHRMIKRLKEGLNEV